MARSQAPITPIKKVACAVVADKNILLFTVYILGRNRNGQARVYARVGFIDTMGITAILAMGKRRHACERK